MARDRRRLRESSLLDAAAVLAALAEAAADLVTLEAAGLAVVQHDEHSAFVLIPAEARADTLIAALAARGARVTPPAAAAVPAAGSPGGGPGLAATAAALLHAAATAAGDADTDTAAAVADETLVVVAADDAGRLADAVRALAAAVPAARVGGFASEAGDVVVFHARDRRDAGSALSAFLQGRFADTVRCLRLYAAGPALVGLDGGAPPKAALRACGRILAAVMAADGDRRPAVAVTAGPLGTVTVTALELPPDGGFGLQTGAANLRVAARQLVPGDAVLARLRAAIAARSDGHAVRIDRLPAATRRRPAARIREEIARLEAEWQIAVGLQAAQVRLLRFDHTQLPAMVDALRRLPQADMDRVGYAFAAAADYPIGCHFLKFSARDVAPLRPFVETVWRAACGGGPIVYWVDPGFARLHHRGGVRSLVMVPEDHVLSPPFQAFKPADVDRHLEHTVAQWAALPREAVAPPPREPIYVFSPDPPGPRGAGTGKVRLEVLDGGGFTALTTGIGFINDCLVLAERIDVDDFIRTGAVAARRREILTRLADEEAARTRALDGHAQELETALSARLGDYLGWLRGEVEALSDVIAERGAEVDALAAAADGVLGRLAEACGEAAALKFDTGVMADGFMAIDDDRRVIETSLARIIAATGDTIASGTARLEDARRRLAEVEARLDRWRR